MNSRRIEHYAVSKWFWAALPVWLVLFSGIANAVEEKFELLQIGTRTYTNVTVTTKAKDYIFILHSSGMASIKMAELPLELRQQLGYVVVDPAKSATNTTAVWAKREMAKLAVPQFKELGQKWRERSAAGISVMGISGSKLILAALGIALLCYLFYSYCCMLICQKTGTPPGVLVWLPVLQIYPLVRAAGMSGWWFLACCVPVLNIVAQVVWCIKIAKARGKSMWVGILLLLPVTNLFAFLYLAFSAGGPSEEEEEPEPKIMTLQAA
jgi:hypothetical protein